MRDDPERVPSLLQSRERAFEPGRAAQGEPVHALRNGFHLSAPIGGNVAIANLERAFDQRALHALGRVTALAQAPAEGLPYAGMRQAFGRQALAIAFPALLISVVDP
jgi:RecB family exonuclease